MSNELLSWDDENFVAPTVQEKKKKRKPKKKKTKNTNTNTNQTQNETQKENEAQKLENDKQMKEKEEKIKIKTKSIKSIKSIKNFEPKNYKQFLQLAQAISEKIFEYESDVTFRLFLNSFIEELLNRMTTEEHVKEISEYFDVLINQKIISLKKSKGKKVNKIQKDFGDIDTLRRDNYQVD
ncbi:eukaryotic translation initiation factor 3 subunit j [Anaeramoeba ignava]|uniref:Eukaryotic translation initiation factor 3 subunit j n=1 Tax=Anaeramoeba ignava TaxID=1746090 RepID=A0A9Q0LX21_ANAIG|nr:eukaryotic translation initiation factor 3 subunit j [Anaeramoeba ignava]